MKKIIITGNLGKDPEYRADKQGNQFVVFSIGVTTWAKSGNQTDWMNISCSGKTGDFAIKYLKKGNKVLIEGMPSVNAYINKEGQAVGSIRIFANNIESFSKNEDKADNDVYQLPEVDPSSIGSSTLTSDDIPF